MTARHKATGAGSVMADVAKGEIEGDSPEIALFRKLNFFPTPPWGSRVGAELVKAIDPHARVVCDPCAGMGHMSDALAESFPIVHAFDVHAYGRPEIAIADWTVGSRDWPDIDWVIMNPPFTRAQEFIEIGLKRARRGVAALCRLSFIETIGRARLMSEMQIFAPFCERLPMVLGRWDPEVGTATAHAWFIWAQPTARGINLPGEAFVQPLVRMIPPGTRDRLWRSSDPANYAPLVPTPLFDLGTTFGVPGELELRS